MIFQPVPKLLMRGLFEMHVVLLVKISLLEAKTLGFDDDQIWTDITPIMDERQEYRAYLEKTEEKDIERELYYNRGCMMCGRKGADVRKGGNCYCGTCGSVWNS